MKEIKCPGENLEFLISNLGVFNNYDVKARLEPSRKEIRKLVKSMYQKGTKRIKIEKVTEIAFQDFMKEYEKSQRTALTLSEYGNTELEIKNHIREHLISCEKCRLRYAKYLDEEAEKKLRLVQKDGSIDENVEGYVQRVYTNFLKTADIFGFLRKG